MRVLRVAFAAVLALAGAAAAVPGSGVARFAPLAAEGGRTPGVPAARSAAAAEPVRNIDGPPPGHTGGFGEPTCLLCHVGADLNGYGGRVAIVGLPERYEPGAIYDLTIALEADETGAAGFQLSARFADGPHRGEAAGRLAALDDRVAVKTAENGLAYAQHTRQGIRTSDPGGATWTLRWTAPEAGGAVTLNVAANSANGDDSPLSDLVYASEVVVPPGT